jgi:hypothetical protein
MPLPQNIQGMNRCCILLLTYARTIVGGAQRLLEVVSVFFAAIVTVDAAPTVTLAWDGNPEPDIAGYRLNYGTTSGAPTQTLEVGNNTTVTVSGLSYATTYYFTVVAYNTAGMVSAPSNEVSHTTPSLEIQKLTVENGTGSGNYAPGTQVLVTANPPPKHQKFERWLGDYQILLDPTNSTTLATIPFQDVTIAATYSTFPPGQ